MPLPAGWPPRLPEGLRSLRFYKEGVATVDYADRAYLFIDTTGANPFVPLPKIAPGSTTTVILGASPRGTGQNDLDAPKPSIWSGNIRIINDGGGDLTFSFDGVNDHGKLKANESLVYRNRHEAGIAVKGDGVSFRIEAW